MPDVLLIFPNIYYNKIFHTMTIHQSLSLGYLAAVLEQHKITVEILDASAERSTPNDVLNRIRNLNPKIIGITTNITTSRYGILIAKAIKKAFPSKKVIFGGPWATCSYEFLLSRNLADFVVLGEGEYTLLEITQKILGGDSSDFEKVLGIAYCGKDGIIKTPERPLIEDLDALPFPAWHLFPPTSKYNVCSRRSPYFPIMTSRGCPYPCINCTKLIHGEKYRTRSMDNVIKEIEYLKSNYNARELLVIDDNFTLQRARAVSILKEIIRRNLDVKMQFSNGIRADIMDRRLLSYMDHAGVYKIALGIESGNQENVNKLGKKLDLKKVIRASRLLKQFPQFTTYGFFMIGLPFDTAKTMAQTVSFAKAIDLDHSFFFKTIVFPGTKMFDLVQKMDPTFYYSFIEGVPGGYNVSAANFETNMLSSKDVYFWFRAAYRMFYIRPRKIISVFSKVRSFSELKWLISYVFVAFSYILRLENK